MKKLILVFISLAIFAGKSTAQSQIRLSTAELKEMMAMNAPHLLPRYESACRLSGIGTGLTIGGVAAIILGAATADKETVNTATSTQVNLSGPGAGVAVAGFLCTATGIPLWIVGGVKKKNLKNKYFNEFGENTKAPSPYLQLNPSRNGIGLALVF